MNSLVTDAQKAGERVGLTFDRISIEGGVPLNGRIEVSAPGWNPSNTTCANGCHGTERWDD